MAGRAGFRESGLGWPDAMVPAGTSGRQPAEQAQGAGGLPLESGLGFRLGRAHRLLRAAWEEVIADLGLSAPQAAVLRMVAQEPGCGLRELARRMRTDVMNVKRLADHLEGAGLVRSAADPGHRQRRVLRPTPQGEALAGELARRAAEHQRTLVRAAGPAGLARLEGLLDQLERALAAGDASRAEGT